jgi:tetratricopeptide (TPR) repeat protein
MTISKHILTFITQIFCVVCIAQKEEIDRLKEALPLLYNIQKVDGLLKISFAYGHVNNDTDNIFAPLNCDSATFYASIALKEAEKITYEKGIANAYENLGEMAYCYNFRDGEKYFRQAVFAYNKISDSSNLSWSYLWLGFYIMWQGRFAEARPFFEKSLSYYRLTNNEAREARTYNLLGQSCLMEGYYKKSFEYCWKAITILRKEIKYQNDPINVNSILGHLFLLAGDTTSALSYYHQSAGYSKKYKKTEYIEGLGLINFLQRNYDSALYYYKLNDSSENNSDIGEIYMLKKEYAKALPYFFKPLPTAKLLNNTYYVMVLLDDIANTYAYQRKWQLSLQYATQLYETAKATHARKFIKDASLIIWNVYDSEKNTDSAYKYRLLFDNINDSIAEDELSRNMAVAEMKTSERQKQSQIDLLNKDNKIKQQQIENKSQQRNMLIAGMLLLITSGFITFRSFTLKRKNEKLVNEKKQSVLQSKAAELELQALRAQMNPHFIFNCLNSINGFIINNEAARAADYLTKFAKLIRIVLQQSGKSYVPLEDELYCLKLYMDLEALRIEKPFTYDINYGGIDVSSLMLPTLLIQPFVENAIWHGLQTRNDGNGKISINMNVLDSVLYCKICDNGIGRAAATAKEQMNSDKKSMGINLTEHRLQLIDPLKKERVGVEIHDLVNDAGHSEGTCVNIKIPCKNNFI